MGLEGGIFIVNDGLEIDDREVISNGWEMVERNVQRVTAIVKDLLFCAKERAPEFDHNVCPQEILLEVRDLYAARMADENIEIVADVPLPHHRGTFDPEAIHSLLCNLVANAIDACRFDSSEQKNGHQVILRCLRNDDGHTVFQVEDDGEGIPEELTLKVFNEFFSSKGTEGTGIGLLVVQKVAEEHGGTVTFHSHPGAGTIFTVTIPEEIQLPVVQYAPDEPARLESQSG
jgi:signal transduction histidine kinase